MSVNADAVYLLEPVGDFVALEQRYVACAAYVAELEVPDGADKSVYGQAGHVQLFLKDLEDDHGEEAYEEVGADAVGSLQVNGAGVEE